MTWADRTALLLVYRWDMLDSSTSHNGSCWPGPADSEKSVFRSGLLVGWTLMCSDSGCLVVLCIAVSVISQWWVSLGVWEGKVTKRRSLWFSIKQKQMCFQPCPITSGVASQSQFHMQLVADAIHTEWPITSSLDRAAVINITLSTLSTAVVCQTWRYCWEYMCRWNQWQRYVVKLLMIVISVSTAMESQSSVRQMRMLLMALTARLTRSVSLCLSVCVKLSSCL